MKGIPVSRIFRSCGKAVAITILATVSLVAAAEAQKASQPPSAPPKQPLNLRPGNGSSTDGEGHTFLSTSYTPGWIYVHATNCYMYDSDGYTYVVVYPAEGGQFWTTSAPYQNLFLTACQTGHWIGLDVYDTYGDWSQLYTYDYY
jgi:hypothetical protein